MYISKGSGITVYETFEELLQADIVYVTEYDGFYYFRSKPEGYYDDTMWKVNKRTKEVLYTGHIDYLCEIEKLAKPVDLDELRKAFL